VARPGKVRLGEVRLGGARQLAPLKIPLLNRSGIFLSPIISARVKFNVPPLYK